MTTRIDRRFAQLQNEGRAALVTFTMAGDPDSDTSLALLKALPAAGADVIELGMPFTDPMADGPAIQAAGAARAQGRPGHGEDAGAGARVPPRRRRHPDRADGLLQSDLRLRRRALSRRREGGRRRRPDRGRSAARGGRGALPAGAQGRLELHPAGDPDHRRQAPAGRAHQHVGLRLLRLDHRHHRHGGARQLARSPRRSRASSATPSCRSRSASACASPSRRARSPAAPTAWWSARRWSRWCARSLDKDGKPTPRTVKAVTDLVTALSRGVRGARQHAAE